MIKYIKFAITVYAILAVLILVTGITGCDKLPMTRKQNVDTITITWIKETPQTCGTHPGHINACATNNADFTQCTIRMPEDTADWIVAEEFKHCFGFIH